MKILCFADLHVGTHPYGHIDADTGLSTRVLNGLASFDQTIDYAIKHKYKIIVAAGDMYRNATPSRTMSDEFDKRIKRISDAGIRLLMLDGNHDVSKMPHTKSPMAHFSTLSIPNVTHTRFYQIEDVTLSGETVRFVFLPTYHTADEIAELVDCTDTETYPTVFIFHGTIKGAMLNDWNIAEKETYVDLEVFNKTGIKAVVMGHLHKPQILNHEPLVFYTGSLQRIDFSEENQPKGFVELEVTKATARYNFVEIPSQRFLTIKMDVSEEDEATSKVIAKLDKSDLSNTITRINLTLDRSTSINEARIMDHAYSLGASYVLEVKKNYPPVTNVRIPGLNSEVSEEDALKMYYKDQNNSESKIKRGLAIIEEARSAGKI